jgi:hypothetical protein
MPKITAAAVETQLPARITAFHEQASTVKENYRTQRQAILSDTRLSKEAIKEDLEALSKATRAKLDDIKAEQEAYVRGLHSQLDQQLRGKQPSSADAVLLRRDASDRTRRITDQDEALDVLNDAIQNSDDTLAHAIGTRSRNAGWQKVGELYTSTFPDTADAAAALATVENLSSDPGFNVANQMAYAAPADSTVV